MQYEFTAIFTIDCLLCIYNVLNIKKTISCNILIVMLNRISLKKRLETV